VGQAQERWLRITTALAARQGSAPTPAGLCTACAEILAVSGAAIALMADNRLPGATYTSSEQALYQHHAGPLSDDTYADTLVMADIVTLALLAAQSSTPDNFRTDEPSDHGVYRRRDPPSVRNGLGTTRHNRRRSAHTLTGPGHRRQHHRRPPSRQCHLPTTPPRELNDLRGYLAEPSVCATNANSRALVRRRHGVAAAFPRRHGRGHVRNELHDDVGRAHLDPGPVHVDVVGALEIRQPYPGADVAISPSRSFGRPVGLPAWAVLVHDDSAGLTSSLSTQTRRILTRPRRSDFGGRQLPTQGR